MVAIDDAPARPRAGQRLLQPGELLRVLFVLLQSHGIEYEEFHQRRRCLFLCVQPCREAVIPLRPLDVEAVVGFDQISPAGFTRVVVAERGAEDDATGEQLRIGPVELGLKIFLIAAAPVSAVDVVAQHQHQVVGQPLMPRRHLLGDAVLMLAAGAAVADDRKANGRRLLGRQRGNEEKAEETDKASEATDASPLWTRARRAQIHGTMLARPATRFNTEDKEIRSLPATSGWQSPS